MPEALQISTMSFRSKDGRNHPWVRRIGGISLGKLCDMKTDESAECNYVV